MNLEEPTTMGVREIAGSPRRTSRALAAGLLGLALLLGTTAARAADVCFQDKVGNTLVFKRFRMPRAGDCRPLSGHLHDRPATLDGTVCGASDGVRVIFNFTYQADATALGLYDLTAYRGSDSADGHACDIYAGGGAWDCAGFHITKIPCPNPPIIG
jgi:hypothetical protein